MGGAVVAVKAWDELSSDERLDAVLWAVGELDFGTATGNAVAYKVHSVHRMRATRYGNHGSGNVARAMSQATRVTPALTALRRRGLLTWCERRDGLSGSCDTPTTLGRERLRELRVARGLEAEDGTVLALTAAEAERERRG